MRPPDALCASHPRGGCECRLVGPLCPPHLLARPVNREGRGAHNRRVRTHTVEVDVCVHGDCTRVNAHTHTHTYTHTHAHTHTRTHTHTYSKPPGAQVRASCVEIYNESVIDLVKYSRQNRACESLPVKFDTARASFFVQDLSYGVACTVCA